MNPILVSSDLSLAQQAAGGFVPTMNIGTSQSSTTGESSWSMTAVIYLDFKQLALSGGSTQMNLKDGMLKSIDSYSYTIAYIANTPMTITGTHIVPHPKLGTYGYNLSLVNIKLKMMESYSYSFASSTTAFWTKPFPVTKKVTVSPGVFLMGSPYTWNTDAGSTWNYNVAGLVGAGFSYQLSKRFTLALDYKFNASTVEGSPKLNFLQFGTKLML
jgi:hypothetical protein